MVHLYNYTDYRTYLADYFQEQKASKPYFSYRLFSNKIGFKSRDFIYRVMNKGKRISATSIYKISQALNHTSTESRYFEALVNFTQAQTAKEKAYYYQQMQLCFSAGPSRKHRPPAMRVSDELLGLYSEWYHIAVAAIIDMGNFSGDTRWLSKQVWPRISVKQAASSVRKLEKAGIIEKDESGVYRTVSSSLRTDPEVTSLSLAHFYSACTRLAGHAIENLPKNQRNTSGVTVGISETAYKEIVEAITRFRREIAGIAEKETSPDRVYQLHINLFPLSDINRDDNGE